MMSIENFYWVLDQHLLKPARMDALVYRPFGTMQYLDVPTKSKSRSEPMSMSHVLFFYDQEPIYEIDVGVNYWPYKTGRHPRLLANSEISKIKKEFCKQWDFLDWYYFFHGFAALDWYRDARYINTNIQPHKAFCCLNHLTSGPREYRLALLADLYCRDLLHHGNCSLLVSNSQAKEALYDQNNRFSQTQMVKINAFLTHSNLPLIADSNKVDSTFSARFGQNEYDFLQDSMLHVVTETVYDAQKNFLTEKTFRPIVIMRPFILVAAPNSLRYLKYYGFQTFDQWIDESYDLEPDPVIRLEMVADEIEKWCALPDRQRRQIFHEMLAVCDYNKQHFFGNFQTIITHELVDNFDTCFRIWNNCRSQNWLLDFDTDHVKNILLQ